MKIKVLLTAGWMMFASLSSFAEDSVATSDFSPNLGAQLIIRQVLDKNLLPKNFQKKHQTARLKALLEGGQDKEEVELLSIQCERSLGTEDCDLMVWSRINNIDGVENLSVRIFQGIVKSAEMDTAD